MSTTHQRTYYDAARKVGISATNAIRYARIRDRFEDCAHVRLVASPDEHSTFDDLFAYGDDREGRAMAKSALAILERDGVWNVDAQVAVSGVDVDRLDPDTDAADSHLWETVDSLGGVVGDPLESIEYDYADDLRSAALDALAERFADADRLAARLSTVRRYVRDDDNRTAGDALDRIAARLDPPK